MLCNMSQLAKPVVKLVETKKRKRAKQSYSGSSSDSSDNFSSSASSADESRKKQSLVNQKTQIQNQNLSKPKVKNPMESKQNL
jgi:hypothetical protein